MAATSSAFRPGSRCWWTTFEIEQNGLGFNNLIFMAVVLSELARNQESAYRGLIVEEPGGPPPPATAGRAAPLSGEHPGDESNGE